MVKLFYPSWSKPATQGRAPSRHLTSQHDVYVMIHNKWDAVNLKRVKSPYRAQSTQPQCETSGVQSQGWSIKFASNVKDADYRVTMHGAFVAMSRFLRL